MKLMMTLVLSLFAALALPSCGKVQLSLTPEPQAEGQKKQLYITANGKTITATMADNDTAKEFAEKLKDGPVTVRMRANGFEHYGPLGFSLTSNDRRVTAVSGDIMLYNSNNICIFYGNNIWSYTPLGKVDGLSAEELKAFFGEGDISVTYSLGDR